MRAALEMVVAIGTPRIDRMSCTVLTAASSLVVLVLVTAAMVAAIGARGRWLFPGGEGVESTPRLCVVFADLAAGLCVAVW